MKFLDALLAPLRSRPGPTSRAGVNGVQSYGGYLTSNERNPSLVGSERYRTFSNILVNTSVVASGVRYILSLASQVNWRFEPADEPGGEELAEWTESVIYDMETPWHRIVRRAFLHRFYGFSTQEWIAKRRDDGTIGLLDIESRPQSTVERWDLLEGGKVAGIVQRDPQTAKELYIPRGKLLYLVDDSLSDQPDGLGLLRHCASPARRLARYEELEGYGFETDLRGIPVGRAPFALMRAMQGKGQISAEQLAAAERPLRDFIQNHYRTPDVGILLDSITYQNQDAAATPSSVRQWDVELMKGQSGSQPEVAAAIERVNRELARIIGTEHLLLGGDGKGSLALSRDKSNNIALLVDGGLNEVAETAERDILRPLALLNGKDPKAMPNLKTEPLAYRDVEQVTGALASLAQAGAVLAPNDPAINEVRDQLGLSRVDLDELVGSLSLAQGVSRDRIDLTGGRLRDEPELPEDEEEAQEDEEEIGKADGRAQPRVPKGDAKGGQFAPKGGTAAQLRAVDSLPRHGDLVDSPLAQAEARERDEILRRVTPEMRRDAVMKRVATSALTGIDGALSHQQLRATVADGRLGNVLLARWGNKTYVLEGELSVAASQFLGQKSVGARYVDLGSKK